MDVTELKTDYGTMTVYRGSVSVPAVRTKAESRQISIGYAVVPGAADARDVPVFMVSGGPGGSHIAGHDAGCVHDVLHMFGKVGDVVMVDLRGIHGSTPNFELNGPARKFRNIRSQEAEDRLWRDIGTADHATLEDAGFDLEGHRITEAVADALGYDQINLYGTSFGSHCTLSTVRAFPDRVTRFFITGVEGYDNTYGDGAAVLAMMSRIAEEAKGVWAGAHGAQTPLSVLQTLSRKAEKDPGTTQGFLPQEIVGDMTSGDAFGIDDHLMGRGGMGTLARRGCAYHEG